MIRQPTLTEARQMGAELVIMCDTCRDVIDAVGGEWADEVRNGALYRGTVLCWRCTESRKQETKGQ